MKLKYEMEGKGSGEKTKHMSTTEQTELLLFFISSFQQPFSEQPYAILEQGAFL